MRLASSAAMLPGAGAAGGVALALAAACAGKAVAISRLHDANSTVLKDLQLQLDHMAETALVLGQQDALQFKQQLESGDPAATNALVHACQAIHQENVRELNTDTEAGSLAPL